jgi:hypothetical protein
MLSRARTNLATKFKIEWNRVREAQYGILSYARAQSTKRRQYPDLYLERSFFGFKEPLLLQSAEYRKLQQLEHRASALYSLEERAKAGKITARQVATKAQFEATIRRMIRHEAGLKSALARGELY